MRNTFFRQIIRITQKFVAGEMSAQNSIVGTIIEEYYVEEEMCFSFQTGCSNKSEDTTIGKTNRKQRLPYCIDPYPER